MADINPSYLSLDAREHMKRSFLHDYEFPLIVINDLYTQERYAHLRDLILRLSFKKEKSLLKYSYEHATVPSFLYAQIFTAEIRDVLSFLLDKPSGHVAIQAYHLTWKDYRLFHDDLTELPGIDVIFDFSDHWPSDAGGSIVYSTSDGDRYPLPTKGNSLALVKRPASVQKCFQYVNHYGKGYHRRFVLGVLKNDDTL